MNSGSSTGEAQTAWQHGVESERLAADAEGTTRDPSGLPDEVLLRICRLRKSDPQVTPERLSDLRRVTLILADPGVCQDECLEAAMALLAAELGKMPQFNPTQLPFGYSGPRLCPPDWIERAALEHVGKQIIGLLWPDTAADMVAAAVQDAVSEGIRLGFLEQRRYDAWRPGMPSGSGWRVAVTATPYGVTRGLVMASASHGQHSAGPQPRVAATREKEDNPQAMAARDSETPSDISDVRDVLVLLGVRWRTDEHVTRLHALSERSLFAARQMIGVFSLADASSAAACPGSELWLQHLLETSVAVQLFPDDVSCAASSWDALARIWDEYLAHVREYHLTGVHSITEGDPWSIRAAVKAAWSIEFASVASPVEIGPIATDSAHRAALRCAPDLWLAFQQYSNEATDHPAERTRLWDAFTSRWCSETVQNQCDRVRARLAMEVAEMRARLAAWAPALREAPMAAKSRQYRARLAALHGARGLSAEEPSVRETRTVQQAAARLADELDVWVEATNDAEADLHPASGYWTVLAEDLEELLGPAELTTGVFEDDWTPLLTQLRMCGLSELAATLERLAEEVLPQAQELARDMDAVAYLRNGGPRDAFYDLYARDDLATHEACVLESRRDVARGVIKIVGTLRTLAKGEVGGSIPAAAMPKRDQKPRPRRGTRAANVEKLEKELEKHVLAARDHAHSLRDRGREPVLLPRPNQRELARRTGLTESDVSRCLKDRRATILRILWDTANSLDDTMRYRRRR